MDLHDISREYGCIFISVELLFYCGVLLRYVYVVTLLDSALQDSAKPDFAGLLVTMDPFRSALLGFRVW